MMRKSLEIGLIVLSGAAALAVLLLMPLQDGSESLSFDAKLVAIATELTAASGEGDHHQRFKAARMPEVAAFAVLGRDGTSRFPAPEAFSTFAEKRLLDRVRNLEMPETGQVSWIARPMNDTGMSIGCYGGAGEATCVALHPGAMTFSTVARSDRGIIAAMLGTLLLTMMTGALIRYFHDAGHSVRWPSGDVFQMGDLSVAPGALRAWRKGEPDPIDLTARELRLLQVLWNNPGQALSRDYLFDEVWGMNYMANSRALDQFVSKLRRKIDPIADGPQIIRTVRGIGYRYDPPGPLVTC